MPAFIVFRNISQFEFYECKFCTNANMLDYFKTSILFMNCSHLVTKWSLRDMKIDLIFHPEFLFKCHITAKDGHKKKMQQKLHSAQWLNFHFINKTDMKKSEKIAQTEISAPKNSTQMHNIT